MPVTSWATVSALFWKDWRSEWRMRAAINAIALFSIAAPVALSFSVARQKLEPETLAGLLWTTLLFAALIGLSRAWIKEEESGTATQLRLHAAPETVLWGKTLFNGALLFLTQLGAVPVLLILLGARIEQPLLLIAVLILGDIGLATASALLGAMSAGSRSRGALFCAIAVPVLLPLLVSAAAATALALGAPMGPGDSAFFSPPVQALFAYDIALLAAAWMLFEFVWTS